MNGEEIGNGAGNLSSLQGVPWFSACTEEQLADIVRLAEHLDIQADEVILREGRRGRELFIILEGTATVTRSGREVNILGAGEHFGELAAIEDRPRTATVTAKTDLKVLVIGPRELEALMEIPGFRNALLRGMSRRIRQADDRLEAYADREEGNGQAAPGGRSTE
jgi:CRP-like cAMP-binding protein